MNACLRGVLLTPQADPQRLLLLKVVLHICRGCAKTHFTTDEAALKQLASLHPLPGLVLEFRCMQNILNKWVEPDWVKQTAAANTGTTPNHAHRENSNRTVSTAATIAQKCQASSVGEADSSVHVFRV